LLTKVIKSCRLIPAAADGNFHRSRSNGVSNPENSLDRLDTLRRRMNNRFRESNRENILNFVEKLSISY
jgi:hypothetical protein